MRTEFEKLSENEMSQIKGGEGQWILYDGQWYWIDKLDSDGREQEKRNYLKPLDILSKISLYLICILPLLVTQKT